MKQKGIILLIIGIICLGIVAVVSLHEPTDNNSGATRTATTDYKLMIPDLSKMGTDIQITETKDQYTAIINSTTPDVYNRIIDETCQDVFTRLSYNIHSDNGSSYQAYSKDNKYVLDVIYIIGGKYTMVTVTEKSQGGK